MTGWPNPCIICYRELENAIGEDSVGQPYAGTAFLTSGHYGSTVFDPMSQYRSLRIVLCDECLVGAAKAGLVLYEIITPRISVIDQKLWDGKEGRND